MSAGWYGRIGPTTHGRATVQMPVAKRAVLSGPTKNFLGLGPSDDERRGAYRGLFRGRLSAVELEVIRDATNRAWALGDDRFREKVEALSARRSGPLPQGRPRKRGGQGNDG